MLYSSLAVIIPPHLTGYLGPLVILECDSFYMLNLWHCYCRELDAQTNKWFYSQFRKSKRNKKTNNVVTGGEIVRASIRRARRDGKLDKMCCCFPFKQRRNSIPYSIMFCVGSNNFSCVVRYFSLHKDACILSVYVQKLVNSIIFTMLSTQLLRHKQQRALCVCIFHLRSSHLDILLTQKRFLRMCWKYWVQ